MDDPNLRPLRRADLWTGLGLMAFAVAMLGVTFTFPITDSFGGVRNVWYVSPALLPLLIGFTILLLSGLLVHRAARELGADGVRDALHLPKVDSVSPRTLRLWMILGGICCYVYVLVPRVDFAVATALFLMPFIYAFHLDREASVLRNLVAVVAIGVAAGLTSLIAPAEAHDLAVDGVGLVALVTVAWVNLSALRRRGLPLRYWWHGLIISLATPLILSIVFRYGLLVPMPHEGTILSAIDAARYALLR